MDDQHAIEILKNGDLQGLEYLAQRYYLPAVRAAYLVLQDQAQAEDIVQECFIHASQKIYQLKQPRFAPWFYRMVINAALKANQKQMRLISLEEQDENERYVAEWLVDQRPLPEQMAESSDLCQQVGRALARLTPRQRAVIVMKYYLEMSEAEITEQLHAPLPSIKMRLSDARKKLRSLLKGANL